MAPKKNEPAKDKDGKDDATPELVAAIGGGEKPRLADSSSYKPEIDVIVKFLGSQGALQANIDGSHRREAERMVKENYPETYEANKGIRFTSDKMYIGLSPDTRRNGIHLRACYSWQLLPSAAPCG
eukprot:jgi/Tetstr1/453615/TSEL_040571.t1